MGSDQQVVPNLTSLNQGRYILFLDILGFSNLVETRGTDEVFDVINGALETFEHWQAMNGDFRTIYFSDTFLFYQEPKGYHDCFFLDIYAIAGMLLSALLAKGIPARGAIAFGEFEVRNNKTENHQLYFGKALIEACRAEKKEQWIGITILPSAWKIWEGRNQLIKVFESEAVWIARNDEVLMLMPFIKLRTWFGAEMEPPYLQWDQPNFPNDLKAFHFLRSQAQKYIQAGDFSGRVAVKYHATMTFLREIMGEQMWAWAHSVCDAEIEPL